MIRLDRVVTGVLDSMSAEHTRRITSIELEEVSTFADPLRVRQIVRNLIANGHRHGGASVFIRVAEREGSAVLEVSDDGWNPARSPRRDFRGGVCDALAPSRPHPAFPADVTVTPTGW